MELIKNYREKYDDSKLLVSGCVPDIAPELIPCDENILVAPWKDDIRMLNGIFSGKYELSSFSPILVEERICGDAELYRKENPEKDITFHDQFIKLVISEGCYFKCTYCSERLAFPPFRCFPIKELFESSKEMVEQTGVYDIILMADSLGQYGLDIKTDFPALVRKLKSIHPDVRFAFNNLNPTNFIEFIDDMEFFIKEGYIKHLNLPIQSASDKILQLMNRTYTKKDVIKIYELLDRLNFKAFDTHIIIGFPGETDKDFYETLDFLIDYKPRYVLASKYMEAKNAPSAKLPNKIDDVIAMKRLTETDKVMKDSGIICNIDGSELSKQRLNRLIHK